MAEEGTLAELQNLAAELLEGSRVGAIVLDQDFCILWVSRAFERYFGFRREDLLGCDMRQVLREPMQDVFASAEAVTGALLRGYTESSQSHGFECRITAGESREERWLEVWSQPIRSGEHAGGRIDYFYDITGRKRAEEAARHSEDQLIQAQKMEAVGRLAGGLAHDFNNLLTAINGYTDLILKVPADNRIKTYVGEVKKAGNRAVDLTSKLLSLSRQPASAQRIVDLNQLVLNLESLLRRLIGEDIDLVTRLDPYLGRVLVDPGQLEQVLLNLAVNARDAMPTGGRLVLETKNVEKAADRPHGMAEESCVRLAVSDNGVGIESEVREHIFEPFFTTKEVGKGTGLGLSTAYAAIIRNDGHIEVDSVPGRGTTFRIYFGSVTGAIDPDPVVQGPEAPRRGHERILLVEDDATVRNLVCEILEQQGYSVVAAEHAAHALELVDSMNEEIEFLVTDVVMPGMSGPDLADRLTSRIPNLRILFISGYTDSLVLRHGLLDAEHIMLQKPFDARLLASKVRELLDR